MLNLRHTVTQDPGTVGLYLFALAAFNLRSVASLGCFLILYAMWREREQVWPRLRAEPLFWCTFALSVYALLHAVVAIAANPEHAQLHGKDAARIVYLGGFIAIAWALRDGQARTLRFLALVAAGFVAGRLWHFDWYSDQLQPWWQTRTGLGLEPIALGYYAGTLLLGLVIFAPRLMQGATGASSRVGLGLLLTCVAAASLQWVILSQSRAAWLALLPLLGLAAVFALRTSWLRGGLATTALFALPLALLLVLAALNAPLLLERLSEEEQTIAYLLDGNLGAISSADERGWEHSIGTRITMLESGYRHWLEAPLFGKGPGATKLALQASDDRVLQSYNDYHNIVLDMLVRYGVVGMLLLLFCVKYTLSAGWQAWRSRALAPDMALFLACTMCFLLASSLSNFRLLNFDFRFWLFMVSGPMTGFVLFVRTSGDGDGG